MRPGATLPNLRSRAARLMTLETAIFSVAATMLLLSPAASRFLASFHRACRAAIP
jgi:hypothetical protein